MSKKLLTIHLIVVVLLAERVHAQDYDAMMNQAMQGFNNLNAQMQAAEQNIVQQNMQNPQIQAQYQQYLAQGGNMPFNQYAYYYAATGGFTEGGTRAFQQNERNIQQREGQAVREYHSYTNNLWQDTMQQRSNSADHQAGQVGNLMAGTSNYIDPSTGQRWNLPVTQQNQYTYDQNSGNGFYNDTQGNYYRGDQNGYWYGMQEEE